MLATNLMRPIPPAEATQCAGHLNWIAINTDLSAAYKFAAHAVKVAILGGRQGL